MTAADFWNNKDRAQATIDEATALRAKVQPLSALVQKTDDLEILRSLAEEEKEADQTALQEVAKEYYAVLRELESFELKMLLSGEFDKNNAFLTIHAGAGGTESCDWADMLFRMYQRWIEQKRNKFLPFSFCLPPSACLCALCVISSLALAFWPPAPKLSILSYGI